jgi:hypothetical protein
MPLGTTSHKQGRVAGENAVGGNCSFAGSLGTKRPELPPNGAAESSERWIGGERRWQWAPLQTLRPPGSYVGSKIFCMEPQAVGSFASG